VKIPVAIAIAVLLAVLLGGCLEEEPFVLGPGGYAGNPDGSTVGPATKGACAADKDCKDGKFCTSDRCVDGTCAFEPLSGQPCEDGNKCTTAETCEKGACKGAEAVKCDDGQTCTADQCNPSTGTCVFPTIEGPCNDGSPCTTADHCKSGKCVGGAPKACDDGNPCTSDGCKPDTGACTYTPVKAPCDDGNACTSKDTCAKSVCAGTAIDCDDGNPCTGDTCAPKSGCKHPALTGTCSDGNACTSGDVCVKSTCVGKPVAKQHCEDNNPCTDDTCNPKKGCVNAANTASCDDGDPCTKNDKCAAGTCHKGAKDPKCACNNDKACQAFDKNLCDGLLICNLATHTCELDVATVVKCKAGACSKESCVPATGKCVLNKLPDGAPCDADGNKCTVGDVCKLGTCFVGKPANCDDSNPCTDDSCAAKDGCLHTANKAACSDGNPCTDGDGCAAKACQPGQVKKCNDANGCTADSCDTSTGKCVHNGKPHDGDPCDADGSVCTAKDTCSAGTCAKGKLLDCDDKNPCTTDSCNPSGGKGCEHTNNAATCDDGNPCTTADSCAGGKCQPGSVKPCVDGDKCTKDNCDATTGTCKHDAISGCSTKCTKDANCDDNNPCTTDTCDGGTCSNKTRTGACDDGSVCTTGDSCKNGSCSGKAKSCDDANACTTDSCDPIKGCQKTPASGPCDADGSACTIGDGCVGGTCKAGGLKKCDDGKSCTIDGCDAKTGACSFVAKGLDGKACDADGSVCTHNDTCQSGGCIPGKKLPCDDANPCTADSCDPNKGCQQIVQVGPCHDGNKCRSTGVCKAGKCDQPPADDCDDDNACTKDSCDTLTGKCTNTSIDKCAADCTTKADCDDNNPCSIDTCALGKCQFQARTGTCADGNKCYLAGTCSTGTCVGGKKVVCSDGNPCTKDVCDKTAGNCSFIGTSSGCDDGDACTVGDSCKFAKCKGGVAKPCSDNNACTTDSCDAKTGKCVFTNNSATCDDGDACTVNDTCKAGSCKPGDIGKLNMVIGTGKNGSKDGTAKTASFDYPRGIWVAADGTAYVAGGGSELIRKVTVAGNVTRWAGTGASGYANGPRLQAQFGNPTGIAGDKAGNLYVCDTDNHVVRIIDTKGVVNNFAGSGKAGSKDGYGIKAQLNKPAGVAIDPAALYVSDSAAHRVHIVTLDGLVSTLAGSGKAGFKDDVGGQAQFDTPLGIAVATDGQVYVADSANHRIRRVSLTGVVTTVAGTGKFGKINGPAKTATFIYPQGLRFLPTGELLIVDRQNHLIRGLDKGVVRTVFGDGKTTTLHEPLQAAADSVGRVWVVDSKNHRLVRFWMAKKLCHDGNTCTSDGCDAKTGKCLYKSLANGAKCGTGCLEQQICKAGACSFGTPKNCNDYDGCTNDYCANGVCKNVPIAGCK